MNYDMLEPSADPNASLDALTKVFSPLYTESWTREKAPKRGIAFALNVGAFANLWLSKSLRIFIAYDDNQKPQGYLIGMLYRPLTHNVNTFQIEDWYMRNGQSTRGLFDHVYSVLRYMGVDEVQITHQREEYFTPSEEKWRRQDDKITSVFTKV